MYFIMPCIQRGKYSLASECLGSYLYLHLYFSLRICDFVCVLYFHLNLIWTLTSIFISINWRGKLVLVMTLTVQVGQLFVFGIKSVCCICISCLWFLSVFEVTLARSWPCERSQARLRRHSLPGEETAAHTFQGHFQDHKICILYLWSYLYIYLYLEEAHTFQGKFQDHKIRQKYFSSSLCWFSSMWSRF